MAITSANKLVGQLTQPEYALLKSLTDQQEVSAASLEKLIRAAVRDRLKLARGLVRAARVLAKNRDPIVRRSAVSRAYYGAYHAARATVFAIHRRDEDDHEKLPRIVDEVVGGEASAGMKWTIRRTPGQTSRPSMNRMRLKT